MQTSDGQSTKRVAPAARAFLSFAGIVLLATTAQARLVMSPPPTADAAPAPERVLPVVQAERDFCADAVKRGTREAFLSFLADDGVIFQPTPINAQEFWRAQEEDGSSLLWWPELADIARSGDLGYTCGPWQLREHAGDDSIVASGVYLTVWQRQADGSWKAAADGGITTPSALPVPAQVNAPAASAPSIAGDVPPLSDVDVASGTQPREQWTSRACRLLRRGKLPFDGIAAYEAELGPFVAPTTVPERALVATTGDLGATWGTYSLGEESGGYLRVWRREGDGAWKMVAESLRPARR